MVTNDTATNAQLGSCSQVISVPRMALIMPPSFLKAKVKIEAAGAEATAIGKANITSYRRLPFSLLALSNARMIAANKVPMPTIKANRKVLDMVLLNRLLLTTRR